MISGPIHFSRGKIEYSDSYDGALFWLKASSFWTVVIALTVHFIFSFTGTLASKEAPCAAILFGVLYLPAVVFALIEIFTDWIFVVAYEPGVGYVYLPAVAHPVYLVEAAYFILIMLCSAYVSSVSWQRAPRGKIRRQNRLVCIGVATVIVLGSLSVAVLPVNGVHLPNLVFIGIVVFALLIVHAIRRYGLFTLSPETAVPDILRTMPDGLILVDPRGVDRCGERLDVGDLRHCREGSDRQVGSVAYFARGRYRRQAGAS